MLLSWTEAIPVSYTHLQETRLLREAKEAGCKTGNGMYMLLYQGAASFKLWTGEDMPVEIIKEKYFSGK